MSKPTYIRKAANHVCITDLLGLHMLLPRFLRIPNVVVAGGAVLYLCDKKAKYKPSDIDIFILNKDITALQRCLTHVVQEYSRDAKIPYILVNGNVVTVYIHDELPIQLVLTSYKNVDRLLSNFDFDYVQCALYMVDDSEEDRLEEYMMVQSEWAQQALSTRVIRYMYDQDKDVPVDSEIFAKRVSKAINKGFSFSVNKFCDFGVLLDTKLADINILEYAKQHPIESQTYNTIQRDDISRNNNLFSGKECVNNTLAALEHNQEKYVTTKSGLFRTINNRIVTEDNILHWFNKKEFSDYTIVSKDNKVFYVHRVVLAVVSCFLTLFRNAAMDSAIASSTLIIPGIELEPILRFAYGESVIDNNSNNIDKLLGLIRNSTLLGYTRLQRCAWNQLCIALNSNENHRVALNDIEMLLLLSRTLGYVIPTSLNIDNALEGVISVEDAVRLINSSYYANRCRNVLKWIEAHPKDSDGHYTILKLLADGTHDLSAYFASKVRTTPFVDFIFAAVSGNMSGSYEAANMVVLREYIPVRCDDT